MRIAFFPAFETHDIQPAGSCCAALITFDPANFQPKTDIFNHSAVRQQAKLLKDHIHFVAAEIAQFIIIKSQDVFPVYPDFA